MQKLTRVSALCTLCLATGQASAGWIQSFGQSERCIAMGGACVAREGDFGAFYHNPAAAAGFDRLYGTNMRIWDSRQLDLKDSAGNHDVEKTNAEGKYALAPTLAGYWGINENMTFGLGFGAPFAITADWTNESGIHRYNLSEQSLFVMELTPMLAYKVSDRLRIGAGLNIVVLKQLKSEALFPLSFGVALPPELGGAGVIIPTPPDSPIIGSLALETDHNARVGFPPDDMDTAFDEFALTLGIQYDVNKDLRLGASYRSKTNMDWKGDATVDLSPAGLGVQNTGFELDLDMPGHLQAGLAYELADAWTWTFDIQWTQWSDADGVGSRLVVELDDPLLEFINNLSVDYDASDTLTWRSGLEYRINNQWSTQLGYALDEAVFDDTHVDILTYDSDRHIFSAAVSYDSAGFNMPGWSFTLGLQAVYYEDRKIRTGQSQNLGGFSLPNFIDANTLSYSPNREDFQFGGRAVAIGGSIQKRY